MVQADVVVTATGLNMRLLGGIDLEVDGEPVRAADHVIYKGMMLSGVPNFSFVVGYTNVPWTLKAEALLATGRNVLSAYFRREVTLARMAPANFTIDQYHPDIDGADPAGHRDTVVEAKVGSAFFAEAGVASPVPVGAFFDLYPLSVLTTSTLDQLRVSCPQSRVDERRFRMNVVVGTKAPGFLENGWVGKDVAMGATARVHVAMSDPRCVMTTLAQDDLPSDPEILRALVQYNKLQIGDTGQFPCAGVYAVVAAGGTLRIGDAVVV